MVANRWQTSIDPVIVSSEFEIEPQEIESLNSAIRMRFGLDFSGYEPKSYARRLRRILRTYHLNNTIELWRKVLKEPGFIDEFVDLLSVGLTSLFRDPPMWRALRDQLAQLSETKHTLRIWHAGCSSGEEVWSMAILLNELKAFSKVEVLATDMSQAALINGQKGIFSELVLKDYHKLYSEFNPKGDLSRYYELLPDGSARFNPSILPPITWKQHNLVTMEYPGSYDLVFCRNVMIYFDAPTKERVVAKFSDAMVPDGIFIIGFFDALVSQLGAAGWVAKDLTTKIFRRQTQSQQV